MLHISGGNADIWFSLINLDQQKRAKHHMYVVTDQLYILLSA